MKLILVSSASDYFNGSFKLSVLFTFSNASRKLLFSMWRYFELLWNAFSESKRGLTAIIQFIRLITWLSSEFGCLMLRFIPFAILICSRTTFESDVTMLIFALVVILDAVPSYKYGSSGRSKIASCSSA